MSQIQNLEGVRLIYPFAARPAVESLGKGAPSRGAALDLKADAVEISTIGRRLADAQGEERMRLERVARIRTAILRGTYDVNGKLELIADRLLKDVLA